MDFHRWEEWLRSLSDRERDLLRHTSEFHDFVDAACRLEKARQKITCRNVSNPVSKIKNDLYNTKSSFFQSLLSDEVVLSVLNYLESSSLAHVSVTCTRLRELAYQNAKTRCATFEGERQLTNSMHLLRAKEQIEGLYSESDMFQDVNDVPLVRPTRLPVIRVPTLLLGGRVQVTRTGDPEYNGIYFCTGCNSNGYVFTKPRYPLQRLPVMELSDDDKNVHQSRTIDYRSRKLNCIFAKNFSGQTLLWYLSKETYREIDEDSNSGTKVTEIFSFWAPLPTTGSTSPHLNPYPSQSSVLLQRDQQTWQCLETTRLLEPPVVEIID